MQTLLLIRHAKAKERETWARPDLERPLTREGRRQARAIAKRLMNLPIVEIRTSPALRCVQTVQPLGEAMNIELSIDPELIEGKAIKLPKPISDGVHILCAHGDNIPALLQSLEIACDRCKKGSIWQIKRDSRGSIQSATYVDPL